MNPSKIRGLLSALVFSEEEIYVDNFIAKVRAPENFETFSYSTLFIKVQKKRKNKINERQKKLPKV